MQPFQTKSRKIKLYIIDLCHLARIFVMNLSNYNKLDTDIRPNMHDTNQRTRNIPSFFESICNVMHTHKYEHSCRL